MCHRFIMVGTQLDGAFGCGFDVSILFRILVHKIVPSVPLAKNDRLHGVHMHTQPHVFDRPFFRA